MNIYQKLVEIRKCIDGFTKDKKSFNYSYVSGTQVLSKIYDKMNELQVILEPHIVHETKSYEIFPQDLIDKYGKEKHTVDYIVSAEMEYVWINAEKPEEKSICPWVLFGQQDEISKALGSGLTYSERYFLMKYFSVPTDADDPDSRQEDKRSNSTHTDNVHKESIILPLELKHDVEPKLEPLDSLISEGQARRLFMLGSKDIEVIKKVCLKFGYTDSKSIKKSDYAEICKEIEQ